jgi:hypothetical protein
MARPQATSIQTSKDGELHQTMVRSATICHYQSLCWKNNCNIPQNATKTLRLMPNELGYVLAILLRVVRPIEAIGRKVLHPGQSEINDEEKVLHPHFHHLWEGVE